MATPDISSRTIAGYIDQLGTPVPVVNDIADRTSMEGMTPQAQAILQAAAAAAAQAGLSQIVITAGKGSGHLSHSQGTEWDIKGINPDGSLWTPEQRTAVAQGAMGAGADRFGLYNMENGLGKGTLHMGYSGPGRPAAVWGANGLTSGAASRAFTNPYEQAFLNAYSSGQSSPGGYNANTAALQQALNARGANLVVDGIWGKNTAAAAALYGLTPTSALAATSRNTAAPNRGATASALGSGTSNDMFAGLSPSQIANLQATINASMPGARLAVDGIAGPLTRAAFNQFQDYLSQGGSWNAPGQAAASLGSGQGASTGPSSNAAINSQLAQWWQAPLSNQYVDYAATVRPSWGQSLVGPLFGVNPTEMADSANVLGKFAQNAIGAGSAFLNGLGKAIPSALDAYGQVASALGKTTHIPQLNAAGKTLQGAAREPTALTGLAALLGRPLTAPEARLAAAQTAIGRTVGVSNGQLTISGGGPSVADIAPGGSNTGYTSNPSALAGTGYSVGTGATPYDGLSPVEFGFSTQGYK